MKIAYLFPGQGAQYVGMCKDLYEKYDEVKNVYEQVKNITGIDIAEISFTDEIGVLNETKNTQLAVLTMSLAILNLLEKYIVSPVKFSKSLENMLNMGVDTFIEIGPGKTLSGFVKRMKTENPINILNINDVKTFEQTIEFLNR